jgi:hypothetical protein
MTLQLLITFAICFMSGAIFFSDHKLSRSTWAWYVVALTCSLPAFSKILQLTQG